LFHAELYEARRQRHSEARLQPALDELYSASRADLAAQPVFLGSGLTPFGRAPE
jgi:hypothetical protein